MKTERDYIIELIEHDEREITKAKVMEWMFFLETINPTHMGKAKADENFAAWQKHRKYLEENIEAYKKYCLEHDIQL